MAFASTQKHQPVPKEILEFLELREGLRKKVYLDTLGHLTVGVGHLVKPEDNLKLGDVISMEQVWKFLDDDAFPAYMAAREQAAELGIEDQHFIKILTSVNFQLGTSWNKKFFMTWKLLKEKKYADAAEHVLDSKWYFQTPVRAKDFSEAIRGLISRSTV